MPLGQSHRLVFAAAIAAATTVCAGAGQPVVRVTIDDKLGAAQVRASIDIAAPPLVVWYVITDRARQPQIVPHLESCRIVKRDPAGRWDVREHIINWAALLPKLRTVVRTSYDGTHRMLFKRVDGDMRISQGVWRIGPTPRGSRLYYTALVAPNFPVPQFMVERTINSDLPTLLRAITQASETDATRRPQAVSFDRLRNNPDDQAAIFPLADE